jgi:hypothetical protein
MNKTSEQSMTLSISKSQASPKYKITNATSIARMPVPKLVKNGSYSSFVY